MPTSSIPLEGRLDEHVIASEHLRDNVLGDPHERDLLVYVPPGYDDEPDRRYPSIYVIQGYTGQVRMWTNVNPFRPSFITTTDQVFSTDSPPCLVVYVDAWTAYGGSQYVDSAGTGRYHSYLCDEVVTWVDQNYRTIDSPSARAITGKSSGGFGAMITPMLRPDLFGALATHAGDALYEFCYLTEFAQVVRALRDYDGDIQAWWRAFHERPAFSRPSDPAVITALGVSACFSADDQGRPVLPFDPRTGVLRPDVWQRWLDWDPVRMVPRFADACRAWHSVWIDAGSSDDYYLDVGAQAFQQALTHIGVPDDRVHFELFPGTHAAIDHRYPMALRWLAARMTTAAAS
jgi:S-formylglutathione hydrolase FrmB